MIGSGNFNFSFSGLKTSVRYFLESGFKAEDVPDICASFQEAIVDVLVTKLARAALECGRSLLALSGGVSANVRLRERVTQTCEEAGMHSRTPPAELRTDNALMIAYAASHRAERPSAITSDVHPNFDPAAFLHHTARGLSTSPPPL